MTLVLPLLVEAVNYEASTHFGCFHTCSYRWVLVLLRMITLELKFIYDLVVPLLLLGQMFFCKGQFLVNVVMQHARYGQCLWLNFVCFEQVSREIVYAFK
jgi:hypothetical protein